MNCKEVKNLISPYMDGELSDSFVHELRAHLEACENCRQIYNEMFQISNLFKSTGKEIMRAPDGFKDSVMQQLTEQQGRNKLLIFNRLPKSWKQAATGAAAVVLLAFASFTYALPPIMQMADNGKSPETIVDTENNPNTADIIDISPDPEVDGNNNPISTEPNSSDSNQADPVEPIQQTDVSQPSQTGTAPAPVLLNKDEQNIKTTMLRLAASEYCPSPGDKALAIAQDFGAQTESLGQQANDDITYTMLKIIVPRDAEAALVIKLANLGTIISQQEDYRDISTAYDDAVKQYCNFNDQRADTEDPNELIRIDKEMSTLIEQLGEFKQQAEKTTIVLWLQE